jgi:aspartyl-tRNA(Asn)/glutamyl-tRNA(Gln) amidotransferase subunit A
VSDSELCFMTARQLASAYRRRKLSPVEVVDAVLARIEELNPKLNAFCLVRAKEARKEAKKAEQSFRRRSNVGPLCGVPVSIKDLIFTKDIRTTGGSKIFEQFIPDEDEASVARLREAGAIIVGKTNTPEFGYIAVTHNPLFGITRNPWNLDKTAGGSSGGAAAATAAGLCPLALGSDGGGSIRIPAAFSGIFGFKPSFGRVPHLPGFAGWETLAHTGPLTHTVGDAALMMDVMAGPDDSDRHSLPKIANTYSGSMRGSLKGTKVAWSADLGYATVDPTVLEIAAAAAVAFKKAGCRVKEYDPGLRCPEDILGTLVVADFCAALGGQLEEWGDKIDPPLATLVEMGKHVSAKDYVQATFKRQEFHVEVQKIFEQHDFLLTPTTAVPAFEAGKMAPETVAGKRLSSTIGWMPFTYPFNLTGQPAASVPCGFTKDGLPVGLQIVGRRHDDVGVLRMAAAFEKLRPWADEKPPLD